MNANCENGNRHGAVEFTQAIPGAEHSDMMIPDKRRAYRFLKRAFDIAFSVAVIAMLFIPAIILCIAIRIESPGFPLYTQKRIGRYHANGSLRTFHIVKFRSMYADADDRLAELWDKNEADGPMFKMKDDPRVTKIGHFIRKHSIDEIPQFLNCFVGDLSVVGPRPPLPNEVECYDERALRRLTVKPGITGYWQVSGRSDLSYESMIDLDLKYIEERSWRSDLVVIAKTVGVVFTGRGAC